MTLETVPGGGQPYLGVGTITTDAPQDRLSAGQAAQDEDVEEVDSDGVRDQNEERTSFIGAFMGLSSDQQAYVLECGFDAIKTQSRALCIAEGRVHNLQGTVDQLYEEAARKSQEAEKKWQEAQDKVTQSHRALYEPGGLLDPAELRKHEEILQKQRAEFQRMRYVLEFEWLRDAAKLVTNVASKALSNVPLPIQQQVNYVIRATTGGTAPKVLLGIGVLFFLPVMVISYFMNYPGTLLLGKIKVYLTGYRSALSISKAALTALLGTSVCVMGVGYLMNREAKEKNQRPT